MKGKILMIIFIFSGLLFLNASEGHFDHSLFDQVLKEYSRNGWVDYMGLKRDPARLEAYLKKLEQVDPDQFQQWSREEKMAFWINAYNAITIEGILRNYPIHYGGLVARLRFPQSSIRQISGFWDKVFVKVMGRDYTLNDIEHKILRKQFKDPRVHFTLVCASVGCPTLRQGAYTADQLDAQLDEEARNFIQNPDKVRLDRKNNILYLSSIFDWYAEDFIPSAKGNSAFATYPKKYRGVLEFISKYFSPQDANYLMENKPKIKFLEYDWSLNEKK